MTGRERVGADDVDRPSDGRSSVKAARERVVWRAMSERFANVTMRRASCFRDLNINNGNYSISDINDMFGLTVMKRKLEEKREEKKFDNILLFGYQLKMKNKIKVKGGEIIFF